MYKSFFDQSAPYTDGSVVMLVIVFQVRYKANGLVFS